MKFLKEERGFTLIEVVTSLVIITIVLLSFSQLFIQSNKTAAYNNDKLAVINLADAALVKLQHTLIVKTVTHKLADQTNNTYDLQKYFIDNTSPLPAPEDQTPQTAISMNGKQYLITYQAIQNTTKQTTVGLSEKDLNLINVIVTASTPDGKIKSSTEGYVYLE